MINEYMELAFDTNSEAFAEMTAIIGTAMFRKKFDGSELHHIVPVTYFAQNDEQRPEWASISDWGKLIRNSDSHPANQEWNLVYLTKDEHNKVHELMSKMCGDDWKSPSKGEFAYTKIQRLDKDTLEVIEEYDSLREAAEWCISDNPSQEFKTMYHDVRTASLPEYSGIKIRRGYKWRRV